jgi:hypothetical protein
MNHNTIQHKNWFFLFALYIINTSNEDFKLAIKKLVYIYYNKIKMFVIEESLYLIKYFTFKKSILLTKLFLILLKLTYIHYY